MDRRQRHGVDSPYAWAAVPGDAGQSRQTDLSISSPSSHSARMSWHLGWYVGRSFMLCSALACILLTGLLDLFEGLDQLRRLSGHIHQAALKAMTLAGLHAPFYFTYVLPFGILLGGMACLHRLERRSELVAARAAGLSPWQFLAVPVGCAILMGLLTTALFSPLSSVMYRHADHLNASWAGKQHGLGQHPLEELWLRQPSGAPDTVIFLHLRHVVFGPETVQAGNATLLKVAGKRVFKARVETGAGLLDKGGWHFNSGKLYQTGHGGTATGPFSLHTPYGPEAMKGAIATNAESVSFWALPTTARHLHAMGFPVAAYRLRWQGWLALPTLCAAMALMAAGFSMAPERRSGHGHLIIQGVLAGFAFFACARTAEQLGRIGAVPPALAAWAPVVAGLCLGAAMLIHREEK
ncbi:LptF/LptG family permease [Formicincola oecophyllae]|uniref:LptF/LptG family permease n=1 Tax=Formicincola oecophyllae TaxID=2558361 RepID=A0A4Y6U9H1_9PROT|nr:LptF/LptG family permease [Formicincola oecophyllae]QDH13097.1 LptF/LptG family permease [Formicincola oecophyllae]